MERAATARNDRLEALLASQNAQIEHLQHTVAEGAMHLGGSAVGGVVATSTVSPLENAFLLLNKVSAAVSLFFF